MKNEKIHDEILRELEEIIKSVPGGLENLDNNLLRLKELNNITVDTNYFESILPRFYDKKDTVHESAWAGLFKRTFGLAAAALAVVVAALLIQPVDQSAGNSQYTGTDVIVNEYTGQSVEELAVYNKDILNTPLTEEVQEQTRTFLHAGTSDLKIISTEYLYDESDYLNVLSEDEIDDIINEIAKKKIL